MFGSTFLRTPDLFPARHSGESWGREAVVLDLPGGPYRFSGLSTEQTAAVRHRFGGLCQEDGPSKVQGRLFRVAAEDFLEIDARGWEYGVDLDFAPDAVCMAGLRLMGRLDWRPGLAGALWTSEDGELFAGIFENFFRALVAYRLLEQGGVVVHSAGLVRNGGAFLFLGRSGAGKTTVSRLGLVHGATVLSDDLNALQPAADGSDSAELEKLPFTGDLGESGAPAARYPLRALFRLEKSEEDRLIPLSRAEAVACLLACSPFLNVDPYRRDDLIANLLHLLAPGFALRFSLDGGFWSILAGKWPGSMEIAS
ncbi:MAG TPA: hypothetical protein VMW27_10065 [Thermoanaerobaculia bacterium]|nr:hypothetical protein [Thermoanaerobaculia bacterium]